MDNIIIFIKKNIKWIILLVCLIIFFAIAEDVFENEIWKFDDTVYKFVSCFISESATTVFKVITNLSSAVFVILVSLIILIIFKEKKYGIYSYLNLAMVATLNQVLKHIIKRPRPTEFRIVDESGYSFPSGHSMASMAFYGFLIYLIYKNVENKYIKWALCTILTLLIILIGISRIYLGVHYASDVFAGFCLSMAYLILFIKIVSKNMDK